MFEKILKYVAQLFSQSNNDKSLSNFSNIINFDVEIEIGRFLTKKNNVFYISYIIKYIKRIFFLRPRLHIYTYIYVIYKYYFDEYLFLVLYI